MSSAATIDWSKYDGNATAPPTIDFSRYDGSAPTAVAAPPAPAPNPNTPGATEDRILSSMGQTIMGLPSGIYHAFTDPLTPQERTAFGAGQGNQEPSALAIGLKRMLVDPTTYAANWYREALQGKHGDLSSVESQMLSAAPEAVGQSLGNTVAGGLAKGALATPAALNRIVPSSVRSGAAIGAMRTVLDPETMADNPQFAQAYQNAKGLVAEWDKAGAPVPKPLRALVDEVDKASASDTGGQGEPYTFKDAFAARKAMRGVTFNKLDSASPSADNIRAMGKLVGEPLTQSLQDVATKRGIGEDWAAQQAEYAKGAAWQRAADSYPARVVGGAIGAGTGAELGSMTGIPHAGWGGAGIGGSVGAAIPGWVMGKIIDRPGAGAAVLSQVPTPPVDAMPPPVPAEWKPNPVADEALKQQNITRMQAEDPTAFTRSPNPFDATEDATGTIERSLGRRASDTAGAPPRPPAIWSSEERTINTAPAGQAIEATGPKGETEHTIAPEPAWPSEYDNIPRTGQVTGNVPSGPNYSAADLARLKADLAKRGIK